MDFALGVNGTYVLTTQKASPLKLKTKMIFRVSMATLFRRLCDNPRAEHVGA